MHNVHSKASCRQGPNYRDCVNFRTSMKPKKELVLPRARLKLQDDTWNDQNCLTIKIGQHLNLNNLDAHVQLNLKGGAVVKT